MRIWSKWDAVVVVDVTRAELTVIAEIELSDLDISKKLQLPHCHGPFLKN